MTWQEQMRLETGYEAVTTFWDDFSIADKFGLDAVRDTFNRCFKEWKNDCKYLTELVMVLNHKIWQYYENRNIELSKLYDTLWREADGWAMENLKGEELSYFIQTLD